VPTHATAATFRMDLAHEPAQRDALEQMIVPGVRNAPGVVSGTWMLDRDRSETLVVITYESREAADAMTSNIRRNADDQRASGLELIEVRVLEVVATT
jgi:quinol monooxygenase YgiN